MCGRATLAMLVSRTSIKAPSDTTKAISHGFALGFHVDPTSGFGAVESPCLLSTRSVAMLEYDPYGLQNRQHCRGRTQEMKPRAVRKLNGVTCHLLEQNCRHHRHPRSQQVILILIPVESDSYRYSLHHFYKVSCRVFWRQHTGAGAGGGSDALNSSFIVASAEGIDRDCHGLTGAHILQLSLFEIASHPDVAYIKRDHREEKLAGGYDLADLNGALAGNSACSGANS